MLEVAARFTTLLVCLNWFKVGVIGGETYLVEYFDIGTLLQVGVLLFLGSGALVSITIIFYFFVLLY